MRNLLLAVLLLGGCAKAPDPRDKEIVALRERANECERVADNAKAADAKRAAAYLARARSRIALDKAWQKDRLAKLERLIAATGIAPVDAARVENGLFLGLQRQGQADSLFQQVLHYDPTDENNRVVDPVKALTAMKSLIDLIAKRAEANDPNVTLGVIWAVAYELGDDERAVLTRLDLASIK